MWAGSEEDWAAVGGGFRPGSSSSPIQSRVQSSHLSTPPAPSPQPPLAKDEGLPVVVTGQLQQLQAADQLLLAQEQGDHGQEVEAHGRPQPQRRDAGGDEGGPVEQRGGLDQRHAQLRLAGGHPRHSLAVEGARLRRVEVPQARLLLHPALLAPGLQRRGGGGGGGGGAGQRGDGVAAHVEVDLAGELAQDEVALRLGDVLGVRHADNLDAVHDITVAYPKNIPQTERHLILGQFPREIHFHVRRYPVASLPCSSTTSSSSTTALQAWCQERWVEKEARLRDFYSAEPRAFDREGVARVPPCKSELRVSLIKAASLLYWTAFIAACVTAAVAKLIGGLELLELACPPLLEDLAGGGGSSGGGKGSKVLDGKVQ
ncbi:hypothetical protein CRUP_015014 [Coryphaenoides rupestris]|nr:hypothetical protein CRUP_015014 [Coryphaenoides rupestris]